MNRKVIVIALLMVVGATVWAFTSTTFMIWDGSFDLNVRVSSDHSQPRSLSCQAFGSRTEAEYVVEHLILPQTDLYSITSDPFAGETLIVRVPLSGRDSMSGRELRRFQFRFLAVIAVLPDGRRVGKVVDIPDCRVSREVSVDLP